jgi:sec-independent protein translocase protein TatC
MSLAGHLQELRSRGTKAMIALGLGAVAGWIASDFVYQALQEPMRIVAETSGREAALNFDTVTVAFDLRMQIALTLAVIFASPVWLYQLGAFLAPRLVRRERKYALGFLAAALPLFLLGAATGWLMMPHIVELMMGFAPADSISNLSARTYYDFVLKLVLATGIAFVLPVVLVAMNFMGLIEGRTILRGWRVATALVCVFAALVTPAADPFSMFVLAIPMMALFFCATFIALGRDRVRRRRDASLA